jgi:hypothetical protein
MHIFDDKRSEGAGRRVVVGRNEGGQVDIILSSLKLLAPNHGTVDNLVRVVEPDAILGGLRWTRRSNVLVIKPDEPN